MGQLSKYNCYRQSSWGSGGIAQILEPGFSICHFLEKWCWSQRNADKDPYIWAFFWKRWRSNDLDKMLKYSQLHSKLMLEINYLQSCKTRSVWSSCLYLGCININSVREKLKILSDITTNNIVIVMVLETKLYCPLLQRKKLWTSHHYQKTLTVFVPY